MGTEVFVTWKWQQKLDFCCYKPQLKSSTFFFPYWILSWQTTCCLITCLKSSLADGNMFYLYSSKTTVLATQWHYKQTFTACMLQELHHLSNPSVMTVFPFPFLPAIKHSTKYCIRFPFFNVKVETVVTQKVIKMPAMIIGQKSYTG